MAGGFQHLHLGAAEYKCVALADKLVEALDLASLALGSEHRAAGLGLERQDTVGMIRMMMSDEDVRELPALLGQRASHGLGFRRVDGGRQLCRGIVDEDTIVIAAAGKLVNGDGHYRPPGTQLTFRRT